MCAFPTQTDVLMHMYARPGQIQERNILEKKKLVFLDSKCESV